jgi:DME family drug/metabolite transporter
LNLGVVLGLVSAFVWATTSLAIKAQSDAIHPTSYNALRMVVGGLLALAVLPFFGGWKALAQTHPSTILALAGSGIAGIALADSLYFWSMTKIGASRAMPISGTYPMFTWALAVPLLGEAVTARAIIGTLLVLVGIYFLSPLNERQEGMDPRGALPGTAAALAAAVLWAISTTTLKVGLQETPSLFVANAIRLPVGAMGAALVAQGQGGKKVWRGYSRARLPGLVALALYSSGIGMVTWPLTVELAGAARASLLLTASPLIGVPLSAWFLHEPVGRRVIAGMLLTLAGVWMIM